MMSEKLKTIKELADELGVSKQNLQYHVKFLPTKKRQKNNDVFAFNNHLLKEIIDLKEVNKQLLESQKQTQNLLDQQQRLALQDKRLLEEYKAEINDLKALKMPSQDTKEEQANSQPQEELDTLKEQIKALNDKIKGQEELNNQSSKKWYQFWK